MSSLTRRTVSVTTLSMTASLVLVGPGLAANDEGTIANGASSRIVPIAQDRYVSACAEDECERAAAEDFEPFVRTVDSYFSDPFWMVDSYARASQISSIEPQRIVAQVDVHLDTDGGPGADGASVCSVDFSFERPVAATIVARVSAGVHCRMTGSGGLASVELDGGRFRISAEAGPEQCEDEQEGREQLFMRDGAHSLRGSADGSTSSGESGWLDAEYGLTFTVHPVGDRTFDDRVDVADVLVVIGGWGEQCEPGLCAGDADGDGRVDYQDLLVVLTNWGG